MQELTVAKGPNWERKEEKSRSCTVEVPSAARETTSSTLESPKKGTISMKININGRNHKTKGETKI